MPSVIGRPQQPEPFLRGVLHPASIGVAYPRIDPARAQHVAGDTWAAAQVPVGVRVELSGDVSAIRVEYVTSTADLGYRGEGAGRTFAAYRGATKVAEQPAVLGEGVVELELPGDPEQPATVYLPEGMCPVVLAVTGIGGTIVPAPSQPRLLAYGDAVTQGWLASSPAMAWPAVVGRKLGLDVCNLGFAGSSYRAGVPAACMLAGTPADAVSFTVGSSVWDRGPSTPPLVAAEIRAVVGIIRASKPDVPVVIVSPIVRAEAEATPNRCGATLADLRRALEEAVSELVSAGDGSIYLVEGAKVLGEHDLADAEHPGDEGHKRLAADVSKFLNPLRQGLRQSHLARRQEAVLATSALRAVPPDLPGAPPRPVDAFLLPPPGVSGEQLRSVATTLAELQSVTAQQAAAMSQLAELQVLVAQLRHADEGISPAPGA